MTNNTIANVPRELLERAATSIERRMCLQCEGVPCCMPESLNTLSDIRALLSAPSPANHVEDVRAMVAAPSPTGGDWLEVIGWYRMDDRKAITPYPSVCATWHKMGVKVGAAYSDSAHAIIDRQAQRIGELEGLLEHASKYIAPGAVLTLIKSTLSAGKEGE